MRVFVQLTGYVDGRACYLAVQSIGGIEHATGDKGGAYIIGVNLDGDKALHVKESPTEVLLKIRLAEAETLDAARYVGSAPETLGLPEEGPRPENVVG